MIQIQATKAEAASAPIAEQYALKDERKSATPFVLGGIVMAVVLYVKSLGFGRTEPDALPAQPEAEPPAGNPRKDDMSKDTIATEDDGKGSSDVASTGALSEYSLPRSNVIELAAYRPLQLNDSPLIEFWKAATRTSFLPADGWGSDAAFPGARAGTGGGGSSGGSGGGQPTATTDRGDREPPDAPPRPDDSDEGDDTETPNANRAPRVAGPVNLVNLVACGTLAISVSDLLFGATDPDGDALSVRDVTVSSGNLAKTAEGWVFDADGLGPVTISYRISDGQSSVLQTARFDVVPAPPIVGTDGADNLLGTLCGEEISGLAGDDNIDARDGNDVVSGGDGNDHIIGGKGNDRLFGDAGDDVLDGGEGDDHLFGGAGNDRLFGGAGNDIVFGEAGDDLIMGGDGDDLLSGGDGDDTMYGDAGDDTIAAGGGNDVVNGGQGDDRIIGDAGNDRLEGGIGDDVIEDGDGGDVVNAGDGDDEVIAAADAANDRFDGGAGTADKLNYSGATAPVNVNLATGKAVGSSTGLDILEGFEMVATGSGDDTIIGSDVGETLTSNAGNDLIDAGGGNDLVDAGAGNDVVDGGAGNDMIDAGEGDDVAQGGSGDDTIAAGSGNDVISDGLGSDVVHAGAGNDHVEAAADAADDVYHGGDGRDRLDYSDASDDLDIDLGLGTVASAETGHDAVSGFEEIVAGSGNDHIQVGPESGGVVATGNSGHDTFEYAAPSADAIVMHEIVDFQAGDRIRMSKYDIFEKVFDEVEDQFEKIYGDKVDEDDARIQYRVEQTGEINRTVIEADMDRDDIFEITIHLQGSHALVIVEAA